MIVIPGRSILHDRPFLPTMWRCGSAFRSTVVQGPLLLMLLVYTIYYVVAGLFWMVLVVSEEAV